MRTLISRTPRGKCRCYDFSFPTLDTYVRLETRGQRVLIRATRHTFSPQRKRSFIHELAAEGFIDDRYRWFSSFETTSSSIEWLIDDSWLLPNERMRAQTNRFMIRLLAGAGLLWLVLLAALFLMAR